MVIESNIGLLYANMQLRLKDKEKEKWVQLVIQYLLDLTKDLQDSFKI